jgi:hypothetical protein
MNASSFWLLSLSTTQSGGTTFLPSGSPLQMKEKLSGLMLWAPKTVGQYVGFISTAYFVAQYYNKDNEVGVTFTSLKFLSLCHQHDLSPST